MVSRDYLILFIGGLAGSSATFTLYGNLPAALIILLICFGLEIFILKRVPHVRRN